MVWTSSGAGGGAPPWSTISSVPPGATVAAARRRMAGRSMSTKLWKNCADTRSNGPLRHALGQVVLLKVDVRQHTPLIGFLGGTGQRGTRDVDGHDLPAVFGKPDGVATFTAAQIQHDVAVDLRHDLFQPGVDPPTQICGLSA